MGKTLTRKKAVSFFCPYCRVDVPMEEANRATTQKGKAIHFCPTCGGTLSGRVKERTEYVEVAGIMRMSGKHGKGWI
jgi:predicted RNA-binding Zn-ribbon protein involved in translation (DUF1610 family)